MRTFTAASRSTLRRMPCPLAFTVAFDVSAYATPCGNI
jgi:hypothetical protein